MAECLVHDSVPWYAFTAVAARTRMRKVEAEALIPAGLAAGVEVRPAWYF
ncbi:MAG: DarT ssDNA thymidine ADP-ribosyltransferase family protein [Solirubrobacterales bacterium]